MTPPTSPCVCARLPRPREPIERPPRPGLFAAERLVLARQLAGLRKSELAARIGKKRNSGIRVGVGNETPVRRKRRRDRCRPRRHARVLCSARGAQPGRGCGSTFPVPAFHNSEGARFRRSRTGSWPRTSPTPSKSMSSFRSGCPYFEVAAEDAGTGPEDAARELRRAWGMPHGPMKHLIRLLEQHGVLVLFSPAQTSAVDAYSFESHSRPVVILNPVKSDYYRQRFDVAHELGHLVMHHGLRAGGRVVEDQAHRFAAELLMPAAEIRPLLPATMNARAWDALGALKEQWGVSIQALLFRARRLGTSAM